jgi:hypothetical protein
MATSVDTALNVQQRSWVGEAAGGEEEPQGEPEIRRLLGSEVNIRAEGRQMTGIGRPPRTTRYMRLLKGPGRVGGLCLNICCNSHHDSMVRITWERSG